MKRYISTQFVAATPEAYDGQHGYKVTHANGEEAWCPQDVFEAQCSVTEGDEQALNFAQALELMFDGKKVSRDGWEFDAVVCIAYSDPDDGFESACGCIFPMTDMLVMLINGHATPWTPSHDSLLADDWFVVE